MKVIWHDVIQMLLWFCPLSTTQPPPQVDVAVYEGITLWANTKHPETVGFLITLM